MCCWILIFVIGGCKTISLLHTLPPRDTVEQVDQVDQVDTVALVEQVDTVNQVNPINLVNCIRGMHIDDKLIDHHSLKDIKAAQKDFNSQN